MITARLKGGLGNQMFQIAAAHALAKEIGTEAKFDFNTCHTPAQGFKSNKYKDTLFKNIIDAPLSNVKMNGVYTQVGFSYRELPKEDNTILNGYFQSEKYFENHKDYIKSIFHIDKKELEDVKTYISTKVVDKPITGIHVRRGDYLKLPDFHPTCTVEYYEEAMQLLGGSDMNFIFVSDDIEWCKENFKGDNISYSEYKKEFTDFYLLLACDNHIIANSSFSWWAAYLSNSGKVVTPSVWFGPKGPKDTQDIYPKDWIKI